MCLSCPLHPLTNANWLLLGFFLFGQFIVIRYRSVKMADIIDSFYEFNLLEVLKQGRGSPEFRNKLALFLRAAKSFRHKALPQILRSFIPFPLGLGRKRADGTP